MMRIVFGTDGSTHAKDVAEFLGLLPLPAGAEIQVVCVVDAFVEDVVGSGLIEQAGRLVEQTAAQIRRPDLRVTTAVRMGNADHQLITAAEELQADLLVVGSRGLTGFEELVLGSVARSVAQHAHCSVLLARKPKHELRSVLLAHDGSEHSQRAVEMAATLPLPLETVISLLHVVRPHFPVIDLAGVGDYHLSEAVAEAEEEQRQAGQRLLQEAAARLGKAGRQTTIGVQGGNPPKAILTTAAAQEADLIIVGACGASLIHRLLVGSVTDRLLNKAPCSLLVVR